MPQRYLKHKQILELAFKLRDSESIEQLEMKFLEAIHNIYDDNSFYISPDVTESGSISKGESIPIEKSSQVFGYLVIPNSTEYSDEIREEWEILSYLLAEMMIVYEEKQKSRKLKQQIIESEEKYRLLTENATDIVFKTIIPSLEYDYISPSIYNVMGCKPEEFYANSRLLIELLPEKGKHYFDEKWNEISEGNYPKYYDYSIIHKKTKELRWLHQSNDWIKDEKGNLVALQGRIEDITEKKISEEKLLAERNKAENYLNIADVILLSLDLSGNITMINPKGCELLGYSKEEILGKNWIENFVPERIRKGVWEVLGKIDDRKTNENLILTKAGEERLIEWYNASILDDNGNIIGSLSSGNDITDRKLTDLALRESEEKFRALYDNAPLSYQSLNEDGTFRDINPTWLNTLGYKRDEVIGKSFADFLHPDWKAHFESNFPAFKKRGYVSNVEFRIRHKNGSFLDISFEGCVGYYPDGTFRQTYCVFKDITEQKQAELALMESEERYHTLFQNTEEGIIIANSSDFHFEYANPAICKILGYSFDEILKLSLPDIHPEETIESAKTQFHKLALKEIKSVKDLPFKRKDDTIIYMDLNASIIKIKGEAKLAGFFTDITERKLADEELAKHRENLEELVKERTKELEDKNAELERFNSLFVGREFRIKELRDKVKALEAKIEE